MKRLSLVIILFITLFITTGCAGFSKYLPDSYESPDGKYKQNCEPPDLKACTQICDIEVEGHKSKKTFDLDPKECKTGEANT